MKRVARMSIILLIQAGLAYALVVFVIGPAVRGEPLPWQSRAEAGQEQAEAKRMGPLLPVEEVLVNVAGTKGRRFFKTSLALELEDEEMQKAAFDRMPILRGRIIDVLSAKDMDELTLPGARDELKQELLQALNAEVSEGQFRDIYFTEFLVQ